MKTLLNCLVCSKDIYANTAQIKRGKKYCSQKCNGKARVRGEIRLCGKCENPFYVPLYRVRKNEGIYCSGTCQKSGNQFARNHAPSNKGKPLSEEQKKKLSLAKLGKVGPLSNAWRGGLTAKHTLIRSSLEGKQWKRAILERDSFTCQICGQHGGDLAADHIKPFAFYPDLRWELSNGRTLCVPCHKLTPTYGFKAARTKLLAKIENF